MKPNHSSLTLLLAAALLGLTAARAAETPPAPLAGPTGLLGQTYADLTYSYIDRDHTSSHTDGYHFEGSEPVNANLDGLLLYDWMQSGSGSRQQSLAAALRAFCPATPWGKPYVEGSAGYTWAKVGGVKDNSFLWGAEAGVEFQTATAVTVTPYVKYTDAPSLASGSAWNIGARANYWVNSKWAITGGIARDDHHQTSFTIGTNFRY
jgi:hypothetical protein